MSANVLERSFGFRWRVMHPGKYGQRDDLVLAIHSFRKKVQILRLARFLFGLGLSAAIVLPMNIATSLPVRADAGIMRWDTVSTPGFYAQRFDLLSPGDIIDYAVGNAGKVVAVVRSENATVGAQSILYSSNNYGIEWSDRAYKVLADYWGDNEIYNVAVAQDNPAVWIMTAGYADDVPAYGPSHVFLPVIQG